MLVLVCSCTAQKPRLLDQAPLLPTNAKIEVTSVETAVPVEGIDAASLLAAALRHQLAKRDALWQSQPGAARLSLDIDITQYEAGNAFKRWLLPGYGATVLAVRGSLKAADGSAAGAFEHSRGVYAGGFYTLGAWKSIFDGVAADIARDLDNRIRRRGFTVTLAPWSSRRIEVPEAAERRFFSHVELRDLRSDRGRIGTRKAAFGVSLGDVFFSRDVDDYMTEAITDQLRAAGHTFDVADAPPVKVDLSNVWLHTDTTMLYWDVVGEIAIDVSLGDDPARRLECRAVRRTYAWPTDDVLASVLDRCLRDLLTKLVAP